MKSTSMAVLFWLVAMSCLSQVQFQGNFTVGKHTRSRNFALSYITIGLGRTRGTANNYGRNSLTIDVDALRNPGKAYTYRQLAERSYNVWPGVTPITPQPVPYFLVMEPPQVQRTMPIVRIRRSQSYPER